ncbi:TadE/TadG family type IV pilus assembly protein [Sphingomonas sp. R1]|uniref:TadE/TadG family type IV pilus assembly protein n=1 Tax=Sphingomonas sp. R1 TaxID=399176 RepID=UPI002224A84D|nr:TadE family protein [Sphingomonas sp. R1]UYY78722.1 pilus assembly protein [Sphingomonas sp. R1]
MRRRYQLAGDVRGAATVEFALLTLFFFAFVLLALDVAGYFVQRSQMAAAVSAASVSAFANRTSVPFDTLPGYVQNAARLPTAPQVSLACNGVAGACTNANRSCACLSKTGAFAAASCGSVCSGGATTGSTAGYYLQISASAQYRAMVLPNGMLNGTPVAQSVVIRLQ